MEVAGPASGENRASTIISTHCYSLITELAVHKGRVKGYQGEEGQGSQLYGVTREYKTNHARNVGWYMCDKTG